MKTLQKRFISLVPLLIQQRFITDVLQHYGGGRGVWDESYGQPDDWVIDME